MLAIYGAGGFGLQILDVVEDLNEPFCFVSDDNPGTTQCGVPVRRFEECRDDEFVIAIASGRSRERLDAKISRVRPLLAAPSALISRHALIGDGAIVYHHSIIEAKAAIGRHFHANAYSFVAHECRVGDFVTFAPGVRCNGQVTIGDRAYIGTNAVIRQGVTIGEDAVVGMGAVVTRNVDAGATVMGNPARVRL